MFQSLQKRLHKQILKASNEVVTIISLFFFQAEMLLQKQHSGKNFLRITEYMFMNAFIVFIYLRLT